MNGGRPELEVLPDPAAVAVRAAQLVDAVITEALAKTGRADVAVSGGRVTGLLFDELTKLGRDWTGVHLWIADERCVPADDEESNVRLLRERLAAPGHVLHAPPDVGDAEKRALAYSFQLKDRVLDLVQLSIGEDAHTASLFPDNAALDDERTIVPVHDSPKPPADRTSLSLGTITAARSRLILATGDGKADAFQKLLGEPSRSAPSSLLPAAGTTVLADAAAAGPTAA